MKDNWNLSIIGENVVLVPYRKRFVLKYHEWMQNESLLLSTASEPLSLEAEYEMQQSWHLDPKKLTFIVLAKEPLKLEEGGHSERELICMAGDVNLFMNDYEDATNAEIEIMIAENCYRRMGFASEALKLIINYGSKQLNLKRFYAKIGKDNIASLALFKSIHFVEVNYVAAFEEFELELRIQSDSAIATEINNHWCVGSLISSYSNGEDDDDINCDTTGTNTTQQL